jgi:hypothetical protein
MKPLKVSQRIKDINQLRKETRPGVRERLKRPQVELVGLKEGSVKEMVSRIEKATETSASGSSDINLQKKIDGPRLKGEGIKVYIPIGEGDLTILKSARNLQQM